MMRNSLTILILFTFSLSYNLVSSQETEEMQRVIIVHPEDCLLLEQHIADDDVNYKPNVDVRGNRVVPAEIKGGNSLRLGENGFSFYMTHDALKETEIAKELGLSHAQEGKIILGRVTIKNGETLWNGSSLKNEQRDQLYVLCREQGSGKKRPILKR